MRIRTHSTAETRALGAGIAAVLLPGDVVVLAGDLGAGKTVFVQGAAAALGVRGPVTSPTFALVHEYEGDPPVVHIDVYRLERLQEVHDLALEELLIGDAVGFVEWGDVVASELPGEHLEVRIELDDDGEDERIVHLELRGPSWHARRDALLAAVASSARR